MYWPFGQHILAAARKIRTTPNLYAVYLTNHGCGPDTALLHLLRREMAGKPFLHLEVDEHGSKTGIITRLEAFALSFDKKAVPPASPPEYSRLLSRPDKEMPLYIPNLFPYSDLACNVLKQRGFRAGVLPHTDRESLDQGRALGAAKEYLSFVSLMGDVKRFACTGVPGQIFIPRTEGAEVEGMYAQVISTLLEKEFPDTRIYAPFLEDAVTAPDFFTGFFLPLLAGDIILCAGRDRSVRQALLDRIITAPQSLTPEDLLRMAAGINGPDSGELKLLVTGEPAVVFNPFNHHCLLDEIREFLDSRVRQIRILFQPLSEVLYLFWEDWNHRKLNPVVRKGLDQCRELMIKVADILGPSGAFEPDPAALRLTADEMLPLFSGSNGRCRLAKRCTKTGVHGILELGSAYENTGIITMQLGETGPGTTPVLNLVFDGSDHNSNREILRNFIYYLKDGR